jgi:hypothetical protein
MFEDQVQACSLQTQSLLQEAGWTPQRLVSTEHFLADLTRQQYPVFALLQDFLQSFGALRLTWTYMYRSIEVNTDIVIDPSIGSQRAEKEEVSELERLVGKQLCPIGVAYNASEVLLMDGQGAIYGAYWPLFCLYANTPVAAIDMLVTRQRIMVIRDAYGAV